MARSQRLDVTQGSVQSIIKESQDDGSRSLCNEEQYSISQVYQLETGSRSISYGQPQDMLEQTGRLCLPTILPARPCTSESLERGSNDSSYSASLASSDMVSDATQLLCAGADFVAANEEVVSEQSRDGTSVSRATNSETSGLDSVRKRVLEEGFSQESADLFMDKWRDGTKGSYEASWRKWASWAREREIDPFRATIANVVNFLSCMHREGKAYGTINGYRSAISAIHQPIRKCAVGEHEDVCAVMAGIFKRNPPRPKYSEFWDVQTVLKFLKAMGSNDQLLVRDLAMKLAMLLALVTASRSSDLSLLDTTYMVKSDEGFSFFLRELGKTRKIGQPPPKVDIVLYEDDGEICPVACLTEYLLRTEKLRPKEGSSLFLSSVVPYKPVVSSTIAG